MIAPCADPGAVPGDRGSRSGRAVAAFPRRNGFTTLELMVAITVFMAVAGVALELFTGAFRSAFKGEDAVSSVQDASAVLLHLRRDLLEMVLPGDGRPYDVRHMRVRGTDFRNDDYALDPARRVLTGKSRVSDNENAVYKEDVSEFWFFVPDAAGTNVVPVVYRYLPEASTITRKVGAGREQSFALPRLESFDLQMAVEGDDGVSRDLLGVRLEETAPVARLYWRVAFRVRGEKRDTGPETTPVEIESRIFPKHQNRRFRSRWIGGAG